MDTFDPSSPPAPRPKSRTKTCLVIALMVGAVGFLLCAGVCGGFFAIRVWRIKNIGPYEMAFKQVQQAPEVIERLGQPVEDATWVPVAQRNVRDNQGSATIDFKVRGPKGQAAVRTQARMIDGIWGLAELDVTFADGERLSLAPGKAGEEDAPKWTPPNAERKTPDQGSSPPEIDLRIPQDVPLPSGP